VIHSEKSPEKPGFFHLGLLVSANRLSLKLNAGNSTGDPHQPRFFRFIHQKAGQNREGLSTKFLFCPLRYQADLFMAFFNGFVQKLLQFCVEEVLGDCGFILGQSSVDLADPHGSYYITPERVAEFPDPPWSQIPE
jgi:hypothetical protein